MIVAWLVYSLVVSALLAVAALAADRALRLAGRSSRWVWLVALGASVLVPLMEWLVPGSVRTTLPPLAGGVMALPAIGAGTVDVVGRGVPLSLEALVLVGWASLTLALLLYTTLSALALRRRRATWRRAELDGGPVLVSEDTGPAAVGLIRGVVVVPEWVLGLDGARRRLLVRHEREHVRARDPAVQLVGLLAVVALPWNPVAWWLLARLRLAIELDCDARVLGEESDAVAYGSLLLEMGRRRSRLRLAAVSLAEPTSMLERRIRMIGRPLKRNRWKAAVFAALAGVAVAVACEAPAPTENAPLEPGALEETSLSRIVVEDAAPGPNCTPEVFLNGSLLRDVKKLERLDPAKVKRIQVLPRASAVIDAGGSIRLDPGCGVVLVTTTLEPVTTTEVAALAEGQDPSRDVDPTEGPQFTPFTARPELENPQHVMQALQENYPPLLRDAGIGGTVHVWVYIDETGTVRRAQINTGSEYPALNQAALRVAGTLEFSPALNGEEAVPVWVSIPIVFTTG